MSTPPAALDAPLPSSGRLALPWRVSAAIWPWGAYLAAIVGAELAIALGEPLLGAGLHLVLVLVLPIHAAFAGPERRPLLVALVFAPLVRIVGLSLPSAGVSVLAWYVLASLPLFVAVLSATRVLELTRRDLGLRVDNLPLQVGIALLGVPIGAAMYLLLRPEPMVQELTWQAVLGPLVVFLISIGFLEELIFRGVLQVAAVRSLAGWGILYVSLVFAALHIGSLSVPNVAALFLTGLAFAWLVARTGSILGVGLAHGIANLALYVVVPALVVQPAPSEPAAIAESVAPATGTSAEPDAVNRPEVIAIQDPSSLVAPTAITFAPDSAAPLPVPAAVPVAVAPRLPAVAAPVEAAVPTAALLPAQAIPAEAQPSAVPTPEATLTPVEAAQQPAGPPPAPIVATAVAVAEADWHSGQLTATTDYGSGPQGSMRIQFDRGSVDAPARLYVTSTYLSDDGPRTFDRATIGDRSWEREGQGPWHDAPSQLDAWSQVRTMLPPLGPPEASSKRDDDSTVTFAWYDPTRDADMVLETDRATGAPRTMRQTNRGSGSTLLVTYSDWNTDVSIEPPIPE